MRTGQGHVGRVCIEDCVGGDVLAERVGAGLGGLVATEPAGVVILGSAAPLSPAHPVNPSATDAATAAMQLRVATQFAQARAVRQFLSDQTRVVFHGSASGPVLVARRLLV
jgi:hypothetical protein